MVKREGSFFRDACLTKKRDCGERKGVRGLGVARAFIMHTTDLQRNVLAFSSVRRRPASHRTESAAVRGRVYFVKFNRVAVLPKCVVPCEV